MDYIALETTSCYSKVTNTKYIYQDGRIMHQKRSFKDQLNKDQVIEIGRMDDINHVNHLFNHLSPEIIIQNYSYPSSMSSSIIFSKNNQIYKWSFDKSNPPLFLRELYFELEQVFNHIF
jgi:hypothetical protein